MPDQNKAIQIHGRFLRIAKLDAEFFLYLSQPAEFLESLRRRKERIDIFTFQQPPIDPEPHFHYPLEWEEMAILPVTSYDEWFSKQIPYSARKHVKKAAKFGITLRETPCDEALAIGVWKIYNETPIRQGRPFPHYGQDLDSIRRELATYPEESIFVGAFLGEELIGFLKLVRDEAGSQLSLMHILSLNEHREKAPTNALLAEAVRLCAERGIPYLSYSLMNYGNKRGDGLSTFKQNNGFQTLRTPRYYAPLTLWGRLALALGLQHRLLDRLPTGLAARLRALHSRWSRRRLQEG